MALNFHLYRTRLDSEEDSWISRREDLLRRENGALKLARRHTYLDQTVILSQNMSTCSDVGCAIYAGSAVVSTSPHVQGVDSLRAAAQSRNWGSSVVAQHRATYLVTRTHRRGPK